jgi:hypothetical protein
MKKMFLCVFGLCALFIAAGRGSTSEKIMVHGEVLLVGNVPFVETIIRDSQGKDWFVEGAERELLNALVGRNVKVQGLPHETDLKLANSTKTMKRYTLSQIVVIEPRE